MQVIAHAGQSTAWSIQGCDIAVPKNQKINSASGKSGKSNFPSALFGILKIVFGLVF